MILGELIAALEAEDPALVLPHGFGNPHSYRGYYNELAFEPAVNVTVGAVLESARSAVGATYHGYKGGAYRMDEHTECWLAVEGSTGEGLGPVMLALMIAAGKPPAPGPVAAGGWDALAAEIEALKPGDGISVASTILAQVCRAVTARLTGSKPQGEVSVWIDDEGDGDAKVTVAWGAPRDAEKAVRGE